VGLGSSTYRVGSSGPQASRLEVVFDKRHHRCTRLSTVDDLAFSVLCLELTTTPCPFCTVLASFLQSSEDSAVSFPTFCSRVGNGLDPSIDWIGLDWVGYDFNPLFN